MLNNLLLLLTVLVPVVPLGKRLYFKSQVGRAVEQLQIEDYPTYAVFAVKNFSGGGEPGDLTDLPDETIINSINHDERGFEELEKTVNQHRSVEGDIRSFHLLWGEVEEISKVTGVSIPTVGIATTNGLLCAEYAEGLMNG